MNPNFIVYITYIQLLNQLTYYMKTINSSLTQKHNRKYSTNSSHNPHLVPQSYLYLTPSSLLFNTSILTLSNFYLQCLCLKQDFKNNQTLLAPPINNIQAKQSEFVTMIIQKSSLQIVNHTNVKHTFDFLDENIGSIEEEGNLQANQSLIQSVNHTKKYINIKILLPHNYKIIINSIPKNIQIVQNLQSTEKVMTKVIRPIQIIQQTVRLRALKLSQSLNKDKFMQKTKKLNIQWGDTSNNNYSAAKQSSLKSVNIKNIKKTYINLGQRKNSINSSTPRIHGVQLKKSIEKGDLSNSQYFEGKSRYNSKNKTSRQSSSKSIKKKIGKQSQNQDQSYYYTNKSQTSNPFSNKKSMSFVDQSVKKPLCPSNSQHNGKLTSRTQKKHMVEDKKIKKGNQTQQQQIKKVFGKNISQNKIAQVSRVLHPFNR